MGAATAGSGSGCFFFGRAERGFLKPRPDHRFSDSSVPTWVETLFSFAPLSTSELGQNEITPQSGFIETGATNKV